MARVDVFPIASRMERDDCCHTFPLQQTTCYYAKTQLYLSLMVMGGIVNGKSSTGLRSPDICNGILALICYLEYKRAMTESPCHLFHQSMCLTFLYY